MKLYKIYTENKNRSELVECTCQYFENFTILAATGYWFGKSEHGIVIEIVADAESEIYNLAWDIRKLLKQDTVLVVAVECGMKLIK